MNRILFFVGCIAIVACNQTSKTDEITNRNENSHNHFANHFTLTQKENYTLLEIKNPWINAQNVQHRYAISDKKNIKIPEKLQYIKANPQRVAAISTTHIAFIEKLDKLNTIKAVSDKRYVYSKNFHTLDKEKEISEVGFDINLNIEKLLQLNIEVVFLYGISNEIEPLRARLIRAGITPILIGEYMEQHPLGKAEWIKVFGAVFGKQDAANHYFDSIAKEYTQLALKIDTTLVKPTVFTSLPWNDTWHTPGGHTYTAQLIKDAGGKYIFENDTTSINYQYDTEIVFQRSGEADIWINPGVSTSLNDIAGMDNRMTLFNAFKKGNVFNNNKRSSLGGGTDYMESGVVNPHLILKDLITIFHPEIIREGEFYYYQQLK